MGDIINSKAEHDKVRLRIVVDEREALQLRNHVKKVHAFAAPLCATPVSLITRGRENTTKYFSVPFPLRCQRRKLHGTLSCQKIETPAKTFYIYVIDKEERHLLSHNLS